LDVEFEKGRRREEGGSKERGRWREGGMEGKDEGGRRRREEGGRWREGAVIRPCLYACMVWMLNLKEAWRRKERG
jgi:hypothetical protein